MLEQLYKKAQPRPMTEIDPHVVMLVPKQSVKDGVSVRDSEFESICVEDSCKQFTIFDFEISNILSVGATHLLKPVTMANHDVDSLVRQVDDIAAGVDNAISEQSNIE